MSKWDRRFLNLARFVSEWSYDPSTKTGAVIASPDNEIISLGFNGFARGVSDHAERYANRELKYKLVVHCERNAILFADRHRLKGSTLYTYPFMSCSVCAGFVIQSGIKRCVAPKLPEDKKKRWEEDMRIAMMQFNEAGVQVVELELEDPRKTGLKQGLHQLTIPQLSRVLDKRDQLLLDDLNYKDGKFCPLATGLGLDEGFVEPNNASVFNFLKGFGFKVFNTRGIEGDFYTTERKRDLVEAVEEVIQEKMRDNSVRQEV